MKRYSQLILACLAVVTILSGCSDTTSQAPQEKQSAQETKAVQEPAFSAESEKWLDEGIHQYQKFEYEKAIAAYDKAITADPANYKVYTAKGVAQCMSGNPQGIQLIKKTLAMRADYVPAWYDLALAYKLQKQYDESIHWFKKVIEQEPDNTWSYYGIATIYGDRGQAAEAVSYLKKAIALDSQNVKEAARTQSHFDSIRRNPEFQKLVQ